MVGAVEPSIRLEEIRQARTKPTSSITAYDLHLRALPGFCSMMREGFADWQSPRRLPNGAERAPDGWRFAAPGIVIAAPPHDWLERGTRPKRCGFPWWSDRSLRSNPGPRAHPDDVRDAHMRNLTTWCYDCAPGTRI